jgi:hypothetical protein
VFYASFKWLTNPRFAGTAKMADPEQKRFRKALHKHFEGRIEKLQRVAKELGTTYRKDLEGKAPTAPDLWIIDKRGRHRFIEVKLAGDSEASHQLAGMAANAAVLSGPKKVSVEIVELHDDERMFKDFWRAARDIVKNRTDNNHCRIPTRSMVRSYDSRLRLLLPRRRPYTSRAIFCPMSVSWRICCLASTPRSRISRKTSGR